MLNRSQYVLYIYFKHWGIKITEITLKLHEYKHKKLEQYKLVCSLQNNFTRDMCECHLSAQKPQKKLGYTMDNNLPSWCVVVHSLGKMFGSVPSIITAWPFHRLSAIISNTELTELLTLLGAEPLWPSAPCTHWKMRPHTSVHADSSMIM